MSAFVASLFNTDEQTILFVLQTHFTCLDVCDLNLWNLYWRLCHLLIERSLLKTIIDCVYR